VAANNACMKISRVCVFCASSRRCDPAYSAAARDMGERLARAGLTTVYGGGSTGLMGDLADAALAAGGRVVGVLPRFMDGKELGHRSLSEMVLVEGMQERLQVMLDRSEAFVALPGGCGTLEELFYVITRKRLGLHTRPVVIVNTGGYFDPCIQMLGRCVSERFMDERHGRMWSVAASPADVIDALHTAPEWSEADARFAVP
jgi:uncharacterized protein (TIGR00730 family)